MSGDGWALGSGDRSGISRREALKGIAAAAAGAMLPVTTLVAQSTRPTLGPIDVHQHMMIRSVSTRCRPRKIFFTTDVMLS
jgi:hypothetical protein